MSKRSDIPTFAVDLNKDFGEYMMKKLFTMLAISLITNVVMAAEPDTLGYNKFRFGGYGEMVANFKDYGINRFYGHSEGNAKQNHNTICICEPNDYSFNYQSLTDKQNFNR